MSQRDTTAGIAEPVSSRPFWIWAGALAGSVVVIYLVCFALQVVINWASGGSVNVLGVGFIYAITGTAFACALAAIAAGRVPRAHRFVVGAAIMGLLAGLAPISLVVFLRLSSHSCAVMNVLALPWAEPWREIAHIGAGVVWLGSTVFLIVASAVSRLKLQRAAVAMWIWSGAITIPTFFLYFLTVYGDPAPGCIAV